MPLTLNFPLGANGDVIQDLVRRIEILEARGRALQNGAITIVDSSNQTRAVFGQLNDGTYGLEIFDSNGNVEAKLGQLSISPAIYGLGVLPDGGTQLQQVGGFLNVVVGSVTGATNTTYQAFGSPNSVTAVIGPSGQAVVTVQCNITTSGTNVEGFVGVKVDSNPFGTFLLASAGAAGGVNVQAAASFVQTGIPAGTHTWTLGYNTANPGTVNFFNPTLTVQPL